MNYLVLEMNQVARNWQELYAVGFAPVCVFTDDADGFLYVNGKLLTSLQGLVLCHARFVEDQISFAFEDGRELDVEIGLMEEDGPVVESVWIGYAELAQ